jgi:hypothetical protein
MRKLLEHLNQAFEESENYKEIVKQLERDINKAKKQLIDKAKRQGFYENFGQEEYRELLDKYGEYVYNYEFRMLGGESLLDNFRNWIENVDISNS